MFNPDPKPDFFKQKIERNARKQVDKTNEARSHQFFYKSVWQTNSHKCFECGESIPFFNKRFIHHLIEKRKQKEYTVNLDNTENGVILCLICHDKAGMNLDKLPKTKARTDDLLKKNEQYLKKEPQYIEK